MANKSLEQAQVGGIVFGDWKLLPMDSLNWELCHWHEASHGRNSKRYDDPREICEDFEPKEGE